MTIGRVPKRNTTDIHSEDAFIAGDIAFRRPASSKKANKTSIMLRIDPELLTDITRHAAAEGLTRSAWIHSTLTKAARARG